MRGLLAVLASAFLVGAGAPAWACVFPPPTRIRTVTPESGRTNVPTNVRPRVTYSTGPQAEKMCGAKPPAPVLRRVPTGDGGTALDGGTVDVTGTWVQGTDHDPRDSTIWELRPDAPLAPGTVYELVDSYPENCPCDPKPCVAGAPAVFARFTTGDGPDDKKPTFSGIAAALCYHAVCSANDLTCCGPYDHITLRFTPQPDATDDNLVGVRYYVRKDGEAYDFTHPVAPALVNDPVDSEYTSRWDTPLTPGKWHLVAKAFDLAGNEDDNNVEATFTMPLRTEPICTSALIDGGIPMPDMVFKLPDGSTMYGSDMTTLLVQGGGCDCRVARRRDARALPSLLVGVGLIAGLLRRRRRRGARAAS